MVKKALLAAAAFLAAWSVSSLILGTPPFHLLVGPMTSDDPASLLVRFLLPVILGIFASLGLAFRPEVTAALTGGVPDSGTEGSPDEAQLARLAFRHIPQALVAILPDMTVSWRNPAAAALFGMQPDTDIREPVKRFLQEVGLEGYLERAFQGSPFFIEEARFTGEGPEGERILRITGVPLQRGGEAMGALLVLEDVTGNKQLEEDLIQSEERYRNVFLHGPDAAFLMDEEGAILDANPAACHLFGYPLEELVKLKASEICSGSCGESLLAGDEGVTRASRERFLRRDGEVLEGEIRGRPFRFQGKRYLVATVLTDPEKT